MIHEMVEARCKEPGIEPKDYHFAGGISGSGLDGATSR